MSHDNHSLLTDAAKAEDIFDLLNHIAWTDVLKPKLLSVREQYTKALVNNLLGTPLPKDGPTQEQIAGKIYGIDFMISTIESVLTRGEKAIAELNYQGISLK